MKKGFQADSLQPEKIISKFLYWGLSLIIVFGLNFWDRRGIHYLFGASEDGQQIYANLMGVIYNISTIIIPIIAMVLFKLLCDIIDLFVIILKDKHND